MDLHTISEVSKNYGISTRMLRYYEQIGLIESQRVEDYSYRVYDGIALKRLEQIILLRKLRISLKQINDIICNKDAVMLIDIFKQNISEIDREITALTTISSILNRFIYELQEKTSIQLNILKEESMLMLINSLSQSKHHFKEELTMDELNKANETLTKLQDIRIIYIPPMTVASYQYIGEDCEMHSNVIMDDFVKKSDLLNINTNIRHFGFNNPIQQTAPGTPSVGYEVWVSIPDDFNLPKNFKKINFHGGLYAAHVINNGTFDHWSLLAEWVGNNDNYESDWGSIRCAPHMEGMEWAIEEILNYKNQLKNGFNDVQFDLLFPIKEKSRG